MPNTCTHSTINKFYALKFFMVIGLFLFFTSCRNSSPTPYILGLPSKNAVSDSFMVVSAHKLATESAMKVLRKGGNAIDAMVASQFALAVVYPRAGNIAGGGFAVVRLANGELNSLDFREKAPLKAHKNMYLDDSLNVIPGLSTSGGLAVGVPGTVDGLLKLNERYGNIKDLSVLLESAIDYAEKGYEISQAEANRLNRYREDFKKFNKLEIPYLKASEWKSGDVIYQKNLAKSLKLIAQKGREGFYNSYLMHDPT